MSVLFADQLFFRKNQRLTFRSKEAKRAAISGDRRVVYGDITSGCLRCPVLGTIESGEKINVRCGSGKKISYRFENDSGAWENFAMIQQLGREGGHINRQHRTLGRH